MTFWVAGAIIGSSLIGSNASSNASDAASASAADANALQKYMYDTTRTDNAPWRAAGQNALDRLTGLLNDGSITSKFAGQLDNEAGYQFAKSEGMKAIDNSASARGGIGGAALKAGARFAEDNANKFYGDAFNRFQTERQNTLDPLYRMAGFGSSANTQNQLAGSQYANAAGNNMMDAAALQGAAGMRQGNIWGNALNQGAAIFGRSGGTSIGPQWYDASQNYGQFGFPDDYMGH